MTRRTKALAIPTAVKERVWQRDGGRCIICGSANAAPNAHYIARSHGGLGIEENIVTLCPGCHQKFDFGANRELLAGMIRRYLMACYAEWDDNNLIYRKW